ncbi:MAG: aldehyde dehydrogenase family protein [Actinobacteria bacterium]|nr:aldehyde dehydrogenase family protein [Actinomycetota bacterium]MBI3688778.1 aldehyde dehydrogenase family protein [Actinomycetota bacterium]
MRTYTNAFFINGAWSTPTGAETIEVVNPATERPLATVPAGTAADVDAAVTAAAAAFPGWAGLAPAGRAGYLTALADGLAARAEEAAVGISTEMGTPIGFARSVQVGLPLTVLRSYAELLGDHDFEERIGNSLVVREPVGVVAAITPWNYPLHQVVAKVAAALAAGCTVVLKPSEVAPLSTYLLAELAMEAGLPPGVLNIVHGTGPVAGEALVGHDGVDMVSFTGSTRAGRRVGEVAARTVKRVALELGGKSASVLLDDADLTRAVRVTLANCFINGGQTCSAWTRLLVPADQHDEAVRLAVDGAAKYTVGDPMAEATRIGPMVSAAQRDRVRGYIERGVAEGARLAVGGPGAPLEPGYYVRPTVLAEVRPEMTVAQEEIFGPVLSVIPYDGVDDAVRIANGTPYGLAGAVFSADQERAVAVARRLRTGQVDINGGRYNPRAPFGGYKQSGNGRELGRYGLEEFCEVKSLQL